MVNPSGKNKARIVCGYCGGRVTVLNSAQGMSQGCDKWEDLRAGAQTIWKSGGSTFWADGIA